MGAEFLAHHPLPGIELAHHLDRHLVGVGEAPSVPADLRHGDRLAGETRLQRGVAQVFRRREILGMVLEAREVHEGFRRQLGQDSAPRLDQLLMDGIELVGVGLHVLQPVPLHDGRLVEGGRRVGIVFQQLGRTLAVIGEVEAAANRRVGAPPHLLDIVAPGRRDAHALPELVGDDVLDGLEAKAVQRLGRGLQRVDLVGGEGVTGLLGPVGLALQHVEVEAQLVRASAASPAAASRLHGAWFSSRPPSRPRSPFRRTRRAGSGRTSLCWRPGSSPTSRAWRRARRPPARDRTDC